MKFQDCSSIKTVIKLGECRRQKKVATGWKCADEVDQRSVTYNNAATQSRK